MAEIGRRRLPDAAEVKIMAIQRHMLHRTSRPVDRELKRQSELTQNTLRTLAQRYNAHAAAAALRLEAMRASHEKCQKVLQVTTGLLSEIPAGAEGKKQRLWLEALHNTTLKKIRHCGIHKQCHLQLQVEGFSYQAQQARAMKI